MKALIRATLLAMIAASICTAATHSDSTLSFEVFPLRHNLHYAYDLLGSSSSGSLLDGFTVYEDSGSAEYIVHDSAASGDTAIFWGIEERTSVFHRISFYLGPGGDTTYWSYDTTFFTLRERLAGTHELTGSSVVWHFPLHTPDSVISVGRYSNTPNVVIGASWSVDSPDCGLGQDSLWFSEVVGLTRWERSSSWGYCHNTRSEGTLHVHLRSAPVVFVAPPLTLPSRVELRQNFPNPFNPSTTISYSLPAQSLVTLKVFNVLGQEVATLVNEIEDPGYKSVRFDGSGLPSGGYFYRLQTGSYSKTKMLMLVK